MSSKNYKLKCPVCKEEINDDGFILECPSNHAPALLTTEYFAKKFEPEENSEGIFRYRNWLPIRRNLNNKSGRTVTYQSKALNSAMGTPNLWIAFNGYWPEKGATLETTTFKELEAYVVLSRIPEEGDSILVIASAGNTAAAFAYVCSQNKIPCLIIVPKSGLDSMVFPGPIEPCVKVVCLNGLANYYDAIILANRISQLEGFFPEGGVKNVGRREGLGTTMLNATETIGQLPDYYFQAIGSGSGGIAVHEAAKRLVDDGNFGRKVPQLMLSQNLPFVPIYESWQSKQRELICINKELGKKQIQQILAKVLSNQQPPYSIKGGVFDILQESQGDMLIANNSEALYAIKFFEEHEGVDIAPAAGVALATLIKAVKFGQIERNAIILLNITGGQVRENSLKRKLFSVEPSLKIEEDQILAEETLEKVTGLFFK